MCCVVGDCSGVWAKRTLVFGEFGVCIGLVLDDGHIVSKQDGVIYLGSVVL